MRVHRENRCNLRVSVKFWDRHGSKKNCEQWNLASKTLSLPFSASHFHVVTLSDTAILLFQPIHTLSGTLCQMSPDCLSFSECTLCLVNQCGEGIQKMGHHLELVRKAGHWAPPRSTEFKIPGLRFDRRCSRNLSQYLPFHLPDPDFHVPVLAFLGTCFQSDDRSLACCTEVSSFHED